MKWRIEQMGGVNWFERKCDIRRFCPPKWYIPQPMNIKIHIFEHYNITGDHSKQGHVRVSVMDCDVMLSVYCFHCFLTPWLLTCGLCRSSSCCFSLSRSFSICCSLIWLLLPMMPGGSGPPCFTGALWVILCWFRAAEEDRRGVKFKVTTVDYGVHILNFAYWEKWSVTALCKSNSRTKILDYIRIKIVSNNAERPISE